MHRNVTALYRTGEAAERVRLALEEIGIPASDIHVIPDGVHDLASRTPARDTTIPPAGAVSTDTGAGIAPTGIPVTPHEHPLHDASMLEAGAEPDIDRLYDLHLPEEDLRTYQHAIRQGDYVVSAEVDDDGQLERIKEVMRRPDAELYNIEQRALDFRNHDLIAHSAGDGRHRLSEEYRARRLASDNGDEFARIYERDHRLDRR